jgi:hypothetical protein
MKGAVAAATVLTSGSNRDVEVRGSVGWMARRDIRLVRSILGFLQALAKDRDGARRLPPHRRCLLLRNPGEMEMKMKAMCA